MCIVAGPCVSADTSSLCGCGVHVAALCSRGTIDPHRSSLVSYLLLEDAYIPIVYFSTVQ